MTRSGRLRAGVKGVVGRRAAAAASERVHALKGRFHATLGSYASEARRLRSLQGRYAGERCVIIGNGPSLRRTNLALLENEYTFGLNRIYLKFEELGFASTFLVCINALVWEQFGEELRRQPGTLFAPWHERDRLDGRNDSYFVRTHYRPGFGTDLSRQGAWEGGTVTYVAMQLAYYLGFSQVVLIGVDHSFSASGPPNTTVESNADDRDHFDPSYFGPGVRWQLPDLESSEIAYQYAREAFAADRREILDATVGGKLTVFPKVTLDDVIGANRGLGGRRR